jgi:Tfp pilus assembly protein PilX
MPESWWGNAIFSLVPTIVLGLIFWMVMRMILRGDRTARREYDRVEAEERAKLGLPPKGAAAAQADDPSTGAAQSPEDLGRSDSPAG